MLSNFVGNYAAVLKQPGALRFSLTGLVARLPISMVTLGIVLLVSARTGSYAAAGRVSAAYVIANALAAVPQGRLMDRLGQRRVFGIGSMVFALGLGTLIYAVLHGWSAPWPHLAAILTGLAQPIIGSGVRARWQHLLDDPEHLQTAFAFEAVSDELVFMVGPTLVTFLATLVHPAAGLLTALAVGLVGGLALAAQRSTEPPVLAAHAHGERVRMPWGALLPLTLGGASLGILFGATEVATVAFADEVSTKAFSGLLLAIWSFGSLLAGVVTGAVTWKIGTLARLRRGAFALTLMMMITPFIGVLWLQAVVLFGAGFAISPTLIAAVSRLEEVTPRARFSEAMGLLHTGLAAGTAPGAAFGGLVVDHYGGSAAYWIGVAGAGLALLCGLLAREPKAD